MRKSVGYGRNDSGLQIADQRGVVRGKSNFDLVEKRMFVDQRLKIVDEKAEGGERGVD